jgi:hypothetical protein
MRLDSPSARGPTSLVRQRLTHSRKSRSRRANSAVSISIRGITTRSTDADGLFRLNNSRTKRFARFLATAPPSRRLAAIPNRAGPAGRLSAISTKNRLETFLPPPCTRSNSARLRTRSPRVNRSPASITAAPAIAHSRRSHSSHTASRFLPFARRLFNTSRPPCVAIRVRKP